jgi:sRNA-binding carbon storage regulator CsrA
MEEKHGNGLIIKVNPGDVTTIVIGQENIEIRAEHCKMQVKLAIKADKEKVKIHRRPQCERS